MAAREKNLELLKRIWQQLALSFAESEVGDVGAVAHLLSIGYMQHDIDASGTCASCIKEMPTYIVARCRCFWITPR